MNLDSLSSYLLREPLQIPPTRIEENPIKESSIKTPLSPVHDSLESLSQSHRKTVIHNEPISPSLLQKTIKIIEATLVSAAASFIIGHLFNTFSVGIATIGTRHPGITAKLLSGLSFLLARTGFCLIKTGRTLFLIITVPPYLILYELPKWLLADQLPRLIKFVGLWTTTLHQLFVRLAHLMAHRIADACGKIGEAWKACGKIITKVLMPIKSLFTYGLNKASALLRIIGRISAKATQWLNLQLLRLGQQILAAMDIAIKLTSKAVDMLAPFIETVVNGLQKGVDKVTALLQVLSKTLAPIISSLWLGLEAICKTVVQISHQVIQTFNEALRLIAYHASLLIHEVGIGLYKMSRIIKHSIQGLAKRLIKPIYSIALHSIQAIVKPLGHFFLQIVTQIGVGITWIGKRVGKSSWKLLSKLKPIWSLSYKALSKAAFWTNRIGAIMIGKGIEVISWTGRTLYSILEVCHYTLYAIGNGVQQTAQGVIQGFSLFIKGVSVLSAVVIKTAQHIHAQMGILREWIWTSTTTFATETIGVAKEVIALLLSAISGFISFLNRSKKR